MKVLTVPASEQGERVAVIYNVSPHSECFLHAL